MSVTKEAMANALNLSRIVLETIREAGEQGAPSGPIYAALMSKGISLETYEGLVRMLKRTGLVRESNNVLYFVEPV